MQALSFSISVSVGTYPTEILLEIHKDVNTRIFTAALFLLVNQIETTLNTISTELDEKFSYIEWLFDAAIKDRNSYSNRSEIK